MKIFKKYSFHSQEIVKYEEAFTGMVVGSSGLKPTMKPAPTTDRAKLRYA